MTVLRNVTIGCEGCSNQTPAARTVPEARAYAKRLGWEKVDGPYKTRADVCPACLASFRESIPS